MIKNSVAFVALALMTTVAFAAQARTVTITGEDTLQYSVTTITASPGETLTVKLVNNSTFPAAAMSHNWLLLKQSADPKAVDEAARSAKDNGYIPADKADQIIAHTGLVAGGESDSVTFTVPTKPGKYTYLCTFPGHFAAGMKGILVVTAK